MKRVIETLARNVSQGCQEEFETLGGEGEEFKRFSQAMLKCLRREVIDTHKRCPEMRGGGRGGGGVKGERERHGETPPSRYFCCDARELAASNNSVE